MSHTPGPWEIAQTYKTHNSPTRFWETWVKSSDGYTASSHAPTQEEAEATARLIATAPELLAAAELAAQTFERSDASGKFLGDDEHEAWTALNAAIKKAVDHA